MSDLKQKLIACLIAEGADIVRVGNIERFSDGVLRKIMPSVKSVIGVAFRQLRGSRRGVEEGTTYYQYTTTAVEAIEETVMPIALLRACALLEDAGYDAMPQRRNQFIRQDEDGTSPEIHPDDVQNGRKAENVLDFEEDAVLCGIGELGLSGSVLTDEFGPFQRLAFILTDAELEPDAILPPHLCDKCGECVRACPGHALSADGKLNAWQCSAYYSGAAIATNPFMPEDVFADDDERLAIISGQANLSPERAREIISKLVFYPGHRHGYHACICGKACDTECYVHLEKKGVLSRKFLSPFRKREKWWNKNS